MNRHGSSSSRRAVPDPPVRRWPQRPADLPSGQELESTLQFLRCSLSYQNEVLAEISALLEQLTAQSCNSCGNGKNSG